MLNEQCAVFQFLLGIMKLDVADIKEEEMDLQPFPGANSPRWILAHLAICTDYVIKTLGGSTQCPKEWHVAYGPGSNPSDPNNPKPTKEELMAALESGHAKGIELAKAVTAERLAEPMEIPILKGTPINTVGRLLTHLMTSHEASHVGQLAYWRRATGRKHIF